MPNHKMVHSPEPQSKFGQVQGHVHKQVPMTSLANHLNVVSSMSTHQAATQVATSSMCSLPIDPTQGGMNRRGAATPPAPPKRQQSGNQLQPIQIQTSIISNTNNSTAAPNQPLQAPIPLQTSSFDSESSNASTQRGYARNLYSPDFSPQDKFTSV